MTRGISGHIAAAILVAALAACANTPKATITVAFACETIGNAEKQLAPFVVKMDDKAVATLNAARGVARPWCGSPTPPSNVTAATAALVDAAGRFSALREQWVK